MYCIVIAMRISQEVVALFFTLQLACRGDINYQDPDIRDNGCKFLPREG